MNVNMVLSTVDDDKHTNRSLQQILELIKKWRDSSVAALPLNDVGDLHIMLNEG